MSDTAASPAADWLPFDLEVARREPERIRHVGYPDKTIREIRYDGRRFLTIYWSAGNIGGMNLNRAINVLRLAPAQPAEPICVGVDFARPGGDRTVRVFLDAIGGLTWVEDEPPGERAEATINTSAQNIAQQGRGSKPSDSKSDETPKAGSTPAGRAAPQRQNLGLWLALRGRAPWPEAPRVILSSLPVNAFKEWK